MECKTMHCDYCANTLINTSFKPYASLFIDGELHRTCNEACATALCRVWGLDVTKHRGIVMFPKLDAYVPTMPILRPLESPPVDCIPDSLSSDVSREELNVALSSCEKRALDIFNAAYATMDNALSGPSQGGYRPCIPMGVQSSLASDIRYCLGVASGAFVLAIGSVVFFSHLLF